MNLLQHTLDACVESKEDALFSDSNPINQNKLKIYKKGKSGEPTLNSCIIDRK